MAPQHQRRARFWVLTLFWQAFKHASSASQLVAIFRLRASWDTRPNLGLELERNVRFSHHGRYRVEKREATGQPFQLDHTSTAIDAFSV